MGYTFIVGMYIEINLICLVLMLIVMIRISLSREIDRTLRQFRASALCLCATVIADSVNSLCQLLQLGRGVILACEMISGTGVLLLCVYWILFVEGFTHLQPPRPVQWLIRVPPLACIALIALSPWNLGIYWVDQPGTYVRGPLYPVKPITYAFCMLTQFILIAIAAHRSTNPDVRREYLSFELVCTFPLIGFITQMLLGPIYPIVNPSLAVSIIYGYIGVSSRRSNIDFLTGLDNRSVFLKVCNELLSDGSLAATEDTAQAWYLFMMDLNHFKDINDTCGHQEGDRALIYTSDVLRQAFAGQKGCLCRYGGDEFAAIIRGTPQDMTMIRHRIDAGMRALPDKYNLSYAPSIALGCVQVSARDEEDLSWELHAADMAMYQEKKAARERGGEGRLRSA